LEKVTYWYYLSFIFTFGVVNLLVCCLFLKLRLELLKLLNMKNILIVALLLWSANTTLFGQNSNQCVDFPSQIDSMFYMRWDKTNNSWFIENIRHYGYSEAELTSLLLLEGPTRDSVWQWNYYYNAQNKRDYEILVKWSGSVSSLSQKRESTFNYNNMKVSELISNWKNGGWIPNTNSLFEYSNDKLVREVAQVKDKNGVFYNNLFINYLYTNNKLSDVATQRVSDGVITKKQSYTYDASGKLKEVVYFQMDPSSPLNNTTYLPVSRRTYSYDVYLNNSSVLFENWVNGVWELSANYIYFRKIDFAQKVSICHKGKTICVSKNAIPAFLKQGATLGKCTVPRANEAIGNWDNNKVNGKQISLFPNPVASQFTLSGLSGDANRVDIYNSSGSLVQTIDAQGKLELTFQRENLPAGIYFINIVGSNEMQTKQIVFK
jgi:hypothetical protein